MSVIYTVHVKHPDGLVRRILRREIMYGKNGDLGGTEPAVVENGPWLMPLMQVIASMVKEVEQAVAKEEQQKQEKADAEMRKFEDLFAGWENSK